MVQRRAPLFVVCSMAIVAALLLLSAAPPASAQKSDQDLRSSPRGPHQRVHGVRDDPGPQGGPLRSVLRPSQEPQRDVLVR